jgi:nitrogen regulatory protein P-II 1
MQLIVFILNNPDKLRTLLDAWEEAGVSGATILHSSGLGRVRQNSAIRDDLPLIPSLEALFQHEEYYSRTIFTVVDNNGLVDKVVEATCKVVGDLNKPKAGLLMVLPLERVYGFLKYPNQ